jgi:hypothetical protein
MFQENSLGNKSALPETPIALPAIAILNFSWR